jgi:hypothetical protein
MLRRAAGTNSMGGALTCKLCKSLPPLPIQRKLLIMKDVFLHAALYLAQFGGRQIVAFTLTTLGIKCI